jgi:hypothetical protein
VAKQSDAIVNRDFVHPQKTYQASDQLAYAPPDGEEREKILVRRRDELWKFVRHIQRSEDGRGPKKTAASTGMLPPTPKPTTANRAANVTKFADAPAQIPKIPVMKRVMLKEYLHHD